jgi:hypothetical protein
METKNIALRYINDRDSARMGEETMAVIPQAGKVNMYKSHIWQKTLRC